MKTEKKPSKSKLVMVLARCPRGQKDSRCTCVICNKAVEQEVCLPLQCFSQDGLSLTVESVANCVRRTSHHARLVLVLL